MEWSFHIESYFCAQANLKPLPVSENLLCRYVAYLAEQGLAPKTIKLYLSAVRHLQVSMNLSDPKIGDMPRLEQVMKGAKCEYAKKNPDKRAFTNHPRAAVTDETGVE